MLQTTRAVILSRIKIKDNEEVLTTYTEQFGRIGFILFGASSKKNGRKQAFLQPLSLVEIATDIRPNRELQTIKSINNELPLTQLLTDPYKNTTALFLAEFLTYALRESQQDEPTFQFLHDSVLWLNYSDHSQMSNFHISFLVRLSIFLGLTPNLGPISTMNTYFDLKQSEYIKYAGRQEDVLDYEQQNFLRKLMHINYRNMHYFKFSREERSMLLNRIISYYKIHIQGMKNLKTLDVLHAVFDA